MVKDNLSMQPSHSAIRIDRYAGSRSLSLSDAYPLIGAQLGKSWRVALIRVRGKLFQHRRGPDGNSSLDYGDDGRVLLQAHISTPESLSYCI